MASGTFKNSNKGYTVRTYWSSKIDIAGNFSTVTCDHYLDCAAGWDLYIGTRTGTSKVGSDSKDFTKNSISQGTGGGSHKLGTTTHKVEHGTDGKKSVTATTTFPLNATIAGTYIGNIVATGTMVLDDIPRASTATVGNGTLGTAQAFTVTRNDDSFSHAITFSCGTVTNNTAVAKTTDLNPKWTPPLSLASQNPTGGKVTINFTITTYNSAGEAIGTNTFSADYTIPSTVVPTVNLSVTDGKGYLATYGAYIQNMSTFKVNVSATPIYGAAISSYSTDANGITYSETSFETLPIANFGTNTITSRVTDARGNVGTKSVTADVLEYYKPVLNIRAYRSDENYNENVEGTNISVNIEWNVAILNNKNNFSIKVKYRKAGDNKFTEIPLTGQYTEWYESEMTMILSEDMGTDYPGIDADSSYEIEVVITDNFGSITRADKVGSTFTFLHFDGPTKDGTGRNKLDTFTVDDYDGGPVEGVDYSFQNDIFTIIGSGSFVNTLRNVYGATAGDVLRFKMTILDSGGEARIYAAYYDTTADGDIRTDNIVTFTYIDGVTESYYEYTMTETPISLIVDFVDNNSTKSKDIRFKRPMVTINEPDMTYERYIIGVPPRLGIGKIAELDYGADFGLKARFNEGFKFPIIRQYTDLNTLLTPNFYIGENVATYQYVNCPITGGTFYLEIVEAGENSLRQSITTCSKDHSVTYERFYYDGTWGEWRDVYHGQETLYNNGSGTAGTVELLYNTKNFTFLDIYFIDNNQKDGGCMRITHPSNKTLNFSMIEDGPSRSWIRRTSYYLTDYALTPTISTAGYAKLDGTVLSHGDIGTNFIRIVRVMGIR